MADVPEQTQAVNDLMHAGDQFVVADVSLVEVIFALERHYGVSRAEIGHYMWIVLAMPKIECNRSIFQKVLPVYEACPKLSIEDCYLAAQAEVAGAVPLWTFDQKLAHQHGAARLVEKAEA